MRPHRHAAAKRRRDSMCNSSSNFAVAEGNCVPPATRAKTGRALTESAPCLPESAILSAQACRMWRVCTAASWRCAHHDSSQRGRIEHLRCIISTGEGGQKRPVASSRTNCQPRCARVGEHEQRSTTHRSVPTRSRAVWASALISALDAQPIQRDTTVAQPVAGRVNWSFLLPMPTVVDFAAPEL